MNTMRRLVRWLASWLVSIRIWFPLRRCSSLRDVASELWLLRVLFEATQRRLAYTENTWQGVRSILQRLRELPTMNTDVHSICAVRLRYLAIWDSFGPSGEDSGAPS